MPSDPGRNGSDSRSLKPRSRRAFGCITWLYTATLAFLAAAFLLLLPFRYIGSGEVYRLLGGLSFIGLVIIVPATFLAAALGARTYRAQIRRGTRSGTAVGAVVGWTGFFSLAWLSGVVGPSAARFALYAFVPLALLAAALVLYALFARDASFERRRRFFLAGAVTAAVAGLAILISDFDLSELIGAASSTIAAALAGWVAGFGYSRAGGDDMIPPGAVKRG